MDATAQRILALGLTGGLLIMARRWRNTDEAAGLGVAGWMIALATLLLVFSKP